MALHVVLPTVTQRRSAMRRLNWISVFPALMMVAFQPQFMTGFLLRHGADDFSIGVMSAAGALAMAMQIPGVWFIQRYGQLRKNLLRFSILQRLALMGVGLLGIAMSLWGWGSMTALLVLIVIANALTGIVIVLWLYFLSELVISEETGRFFAQRSIIINGVLISALLLGYVLDSFSPEASLPYSLVVFWGAFIGITEYFFWKGIPDPCPQLEIKPFSLRETLLEPLKKKDFRQFAIYLAVRHGLDTAVLAFWFVFLIKEAGFSQFLINAGFAGALLVRIFTSRFWNLVAERFGHSSVILITDFVCIFWPLVALFLPGQHVWIPYMISIVVPSLFSMGMENSSTSRLFELTQREQRSEAIAVFHLLLAPLILIAPFVAGYALLWLNGPLGREAVSLFGLKSNYQLLFTTVVALRLLWWFLGIWMIREPKRGPVDVFRYIVQSNPFQVARSMETLVVVAPIKARLNSIRRLAYSRSRLATRTLTRMLQDPDRRVRSAAAQALGELGDGEAVPALIQTINQPNCAIRSECIMSLGQIGDPSARPLLEELLKKPEFQRSSVIALGHLRDPLAADALWELWKDSDINLGRPLLASVLSEIGDKRWLSQFWAELSRAKDQQQRRDYVLAAASANGHDDDLYAMITSFEEFGAEDLIREVHRLKKLIHPHLTAENEGLFATESLNMQKYILKNEWGLILESLVSIMHVFKMTDVDGFSVRDSLSYADTVTHEGVLFLLSFAKKKAVTLPLSSK